ncbi:MAG: TIGR01777 family oxidoreductase [Planctomycetes bacterium]|nr:TIGR01777 family oxidoreductase [Planctomycetota bacterium]
MRIAISGSSGMVGSALMRTLLESGHDSVPLRRSAQPDGSPSLDLAPIRTGCDAVVHLAGENIAAGRWTAARKRRIADSRIVLTRRLATDLAALATPPAALVCASAVGFYGDRGSAALDEQQPAGTGFLADVCEGWEAAADPARQAGIRVVHLRIGVVLSSTGGLLGRLRSLFRFGLGGRLGSGEQWMSWIHLTDLVRVVEFALERGDLVGALNAVSPNPVTNREFTRALGQWVHRPTLLHAPAFALRALLGEMADELMLASTRVVPARLSESGFRFALPELRAALDACGA